MAKEDEVIRKIKSKTNNAGEIRVNSLLHLIGFEYLDNALELKKNKKLIGELDGIFRIGDDYLILLEIEDGKIDSKKVSSWFNKWSFDENINLIIKKYRLVQNIKVIRIFVNLRTKRADGELNEVSLKQCLSVKYNHFFYKDDIDELIEQEKLIGKWSFNDLASSLGLYGESDRKKYVEIEGIEVKSPEKKAYLLSIDAYTLLKNGYVYRRKESNSQGYQRFLKTNRINRIQKDLQKKKIILPTIILSTSESISRLKKLGSKSLCLNFPDWRCAIRIIDGQHRLMGYSKLEEKRQKESEIPVLIFDDLTKEEEIEMFLTINTEQKKIDPNLSLLVRGDSLEWEDNSKNLYQSLAVSIVKNLNKDSSFKNKIFLGYNYPSKDKVAMATFVSALIKNNLVGGSQHLIQENIRDTIQAYKKLRAFFHNLKLKIKAYTDINKIDKKEGFLVSNKGIRIMLRILQLLIKNRKKRLINSSEEEFLEDLSKIINDKTIKELEKYYGEGGANKATEVILKKLKKSEKIKYKRLKIDLRSFK